ILLAFFLLPLPISRVRQTGLVQIEPNLVQKVTLPSDGLLVALHVRDGQRVTRGQMLAEFRSPKLEAEFQTALGNLDAARAQEASLRTRKRDATEPEDRKQLEEELSTTTTQLKEAETKVTLARSEIDALRRLDAP